MSLPVRRAMYRRRDGSAISHLTCMTCPHTAHLLRLSFLTADLGTADSATGNAALSPRLRHIHILDFPRSQFRQKASKLRMSRTKLCQQLGLSTGQSVVEHPNMFARQGCVHLAEVPACRPGLVELTPCSRDGWPTKNGRLETRIQPRHRRHHCGPCGGLYRQLVCLFVAGNVEMARDPSDPATYLDLTCFHTPGRAKPIGV